MRHMYWLFMLLPAVALWLFDGAAGLAARRRSFAFTGSTCEDFTVLVPIYGNVKYLENIEYLSQYGDRVVLCTTKGETSEFYEALDRLTVQHGFRVFRSQSTVSADPNKRATSGTIRDRIVRDALMQVATPYVVCIDADSTSDRPFSELMGEVRDNGYDIVSVRLVPRDERNWLVKLQRHEYRLAMQLRFLAPWLVSGACHAGTTESLRRVMRRHSLFFQGNDVELGVLAKSLRLNVGHVPFEVMTTAPNQLRPWFRQRLAWGGGEFRLFIPNFRFVIKHPFFWMYGAVVAIATFPLRWVALAHPGVPLLFALGLYVSLLLRLHWRHRDAWVLLMPFYTLFSSVILTPLGVVWYVWMAVKDKNAGIIRPSGLHRSVA